mmetsp:Transcript_46678/g.137902  ORF Transcript_46678/g.137902 Transcript_46678/m.137902 type:complete len:220 (+) Transcript_46678:1254-1913(+)
MSRELMNWLEILPETMHFPPGRPALPTSTFTGGQPPWGGFWVHSTFEPSCFRPSMRSWIGRSRMRGTPSRTNLPLHAQTTPARGRMAVPAFPRLSSTPSLWVLLTSNGPPLPVMTILFSVRRALSSILTPRVFSASSIRAMSSESSRFSTVVVPLLSAARSKARLDSDLEPGRSTVPLRSGIGSRWSDSSVSPFAIVPCSNPTGRSAVGQGPDRTAAVC